MKENRLVKDKLIFLSKMTIGVLILLFFIRSQGVVYAQVTPITISAAVTPSEITVTNSISLFATASGGSGDYTCSTCVEQWYYNTVGTNDIASSLPVSGGSGLILSDTPAAWGTYSYFLVVSDGNTTTEAITSPFTVTVDPLVTSATSLDGLSTFSAGATVTFTATVTGSAPTGSVTFTTKDNVGSFPSGNTCTLSSGSCSVTYTDPGSGKARMRVTYPGDAINLGSGLLIVLHVNPAPTATLGASASTITSGQTETLTADIEQRTPPYTLTWTGSIEGSLTSTASDCLTTGASNGTYTCTISAPSVSTSTSDTFTVAVMDSSGVSVTPSASTLVTVNPTPAPSSSPVVVASSAGGVGGQTSAGGGSSTSSTVSTSGSTAPSTTVTTSTNTTSSSTTPTPSTVVTTLPTQPTTTVPIRTVAPQVPTLPPLSTSAVVVLFLPFELYGMMGTFIVVAGTLSLVYTYVIKTKSPSREK